MTVAAALAGPWGSLGSWIAGCFFILGIKKSYWIIIYTSRSSLPLGSVRSLVSRALRRSQFLKISNCDKSFSFHPFQQKYLLLLPWFYTIIQRFSKIFSISVFQTCRVRFPYDLLHAHTTGASFFSIRCHYRFHSNLFVIAVTSFQGRALI